MTAQIKEYEPTLTSLINNDLLINKELVKEIDVLEKQNKAIESGDAANAFTGIPSLSGIVDGMELFHKAKTLIKSNERRIEELETVIFENSMSHELGVLAALHEVNISIVQEMFRVVQTNTGFRFEISDELKLTNVMISMYNYGKANKEV